MKRKGQKHGGTGGCRERAQKSGVELESTMPGKAQTMHKGFRIMRPEPLAGFNMLGNVGPGPSRPSRIRNSCILLLRVLTASCSPLFLAPVFFGRRSRGGADIRVSRGRNFVSHGVPALVACMRAGQGGGSPDRESRNKIKASRRLRLFIFERFPLENVQQSSPRYFVLSFRLEIFSLAVVTGIQGSDGDILRREH